jgi:hypothetical protein
MSELATDELAVSEPQPTPAPFATVSVETVLWLTAAAVFIGVRIGTVWHAPVGGAELIHLSGAWQASIGQSDDRFVPTLFQALSALLLRVDGSATLSRLLAVAACATIPLALYLLRGRLGQAGALIALLLLALDGPAISLSSQASAMAFDLPLAIWLFVLMTQDDTQGWVAMGAGLAVTTAGPIPLAVVAAWAVVRLARADYPDVGMAAWCGAGVVIGVVLTTFRFGLGIDGGLRVAPLDLFAASFDQVWSSPFGIEVAVLYSVPILVAGVAAAGVAAWRMWGARSAQRDGLVLLAWAGIAALWFLASARSHTTVPLVALTTSLALIAGPALTEAAVAAWRADWVRARFYIPGAVLAFAIAVCWMLDWARDGRTGPGSDELLVAALCIAALSLLGLAASNRDARATVFAALLAVGVLPFLAGGLGVGLGSDGELIPSPNSPQLARLLRDTALATVAKQGGEIVVHPDLENDITWPFRDSGTIVVASRVPADASFVVWPASAAAPGDGFSPLAGDWQLLRAPDVPLSGFLAYLKWFSDRNSLSITSEPVAVYVRATQ